MVISENDPMPLASPWALVKEKVSQGLPVPGPARGAGEAVQSRSTVGLAWHLCPFHSFNLRPEQGHPYLWGTCDLLHRPTAFSMGFSLGAPLTHSFGAHRVPMAFPWSPKASH